MSLSPEEAFLMKRFAMLVLLSEAALLRVCACNSPDSEPVSLEPFRDGWHVEAELPFPADITMLRIGGRAYQDNFANRGDVIVQYEAGIDTIKIEMRRFTMALSPESAEEDFAALSLWAYASNQTSPKRPADMDPTRKCDASAWLDDCAIRVYYDGQSQPSRSGADFRITLPASYRESIRIITEDSDADSDYINRGTVCVKDLPGSAEIELANGVASVILADDVRPIPSCTDAQIAACETWQHDDAPAPWHPDCDCVQQTDNAWGSVRVESRDGAAADITIDAPSQLWMSITARNEGPNTQGETHCNAIIDLPQVEGQHDHPWDFTGNTPPPSPSAVGGYATMAISKDCSPVSFSPSPEALGGTGDGSSTYPLRGDLTICSGCIRSLDCDALIDG
jgi:hypothetical protein